MVEGQGAGTAVALALKKDIPDVHNVNMKELHQMLEEQGVIFDN